MENPSWTQESNIERVKGWDTLAFEGADKITPVRYGTLKTKLIDNRLICMSEGNIYVFLTTLNYWSVLCSSQSLVFINNIIGAESATVRYGDAADPYIEFIERGCSDNIADEIPQSICIGTERVRVSLVQSGLSLSKCEPLLVYPGDKKKILSCLCYMPIHINFWPRLWTRTHQYKIYRFLAPLFEDPLELKTLEWCLGHAFIDPHSYSKTVVLFGEGGHGKSTIMSTVNSVFFGCCSTIPDSALENLSSGVSTKVASIVASNRIVTAGDVGGSNRNTNLTVVKSLTGHDYISIPPSRVKTACTLLYATNTLDDPLSNPEWCTPAIMRRVVVILINSRIMENFSGRIPFDPTSRLDFALRCVHTRLSMSAMPVSPISVMLTLMGSKFDSVCKYLVYVPEDDFDDEDTIVAASIIAGALSITVERVGELAKRITSSCVREISGILYVKNIAPSSLYQYK